MKTRNIKSNKKLPEKNLVVISDTHCGCQYGLCPPMVQLDGGGHYTSSRMQQVVWGWWQEFWNEWVPRVTHGQPWTLVFNGDMLDGRHHNTTTQITQNLTDQALIAEEALKPIWDLPVTPTELYWIRGTEAHTGPAGENEESLAKKMGAKPNEDGQYARYELWIEVGVWLCHITHQVGCTTSAMYESTQVYKELIEAYAEAGRFGDRPPDTVIRSHRHRHFKIEPPAKSGSNLSVITPGWQLKTPFTFRTQGKQSRPQFGGILIRQGDEEPHERHKVWSLERPQVEICK